MTDFAARIGRVRMKNGGADVHVLESKPGPDGAEDWRGAVVRNAKAVAEMGTDASPLVGYLLIGIFGDGATSVGFRVDEDRCVVPRALFPAWVAEIVRRDLVSAQEAEIVFDNRFQWVEG